MTDLRPYEVIVQRAEALSMTRDWEEGAEEFDGLLARLRALGPPDDPRARERYWARFDAARRHFDVARSAATVAAASAGDALHARENLLGLAFAGFIRPFAFRQRDSRRQFWPFALLGLPLGAAVIVLLHASAQIVSQLGVLFLLPTALLTLWWILSFTAAAWRRLEDAGAEGTLALVLPFLPVAFGIDAGLGPLILTASPNAENRDDVAVVMTVVAAVVVLLSLANVLFACAQPTDRIIQWGNGPAPLALFSVFVIAVPAMLVLSFVFGALGALGTRAVTTRVSSSTRQVGGRRGAHGRWRPRRAVTVRAHDRRTGRTTSNLPGGGLDIMGMSAFRGALAFLVFPFLAWRIELAPRTHEESS
ncbi:DUF805 domain-containing protein [Microbacterium sp. NPDC096154]|uniref:DUF805 domain-containing protein n=1 Tax=Microbacterium sp. NPDC096154 TaxID=3155549 RepID=UPI003325D492